MSAFGADLLAQLHVVDDRMVAARSHPISPRWWAGLGRFYLSGKPVLTVRKGRQVYASKGICPRIVTATMLLQRPVPPGEVRSFAVVSVKRSDALDRLANIEGCLQAMGIPHTRSGETILVPALRSRVVVLTASFKTSVGDTLDLCWADELTRWNDESTSSNPAAHVMASIKPSLVTLPNAKLFQVSSPWTVGDYHDKQVALGDTDSQNVESGPTWEWAPHLTEADCRRLASDEAEFLREYGAVPSDGTASSWINASAIDAAIDATRPLQLPAGPGWRYVAGGDFGFVRNASALVIAGRRDGDPAVHVCATLEIVPSASAPLDTRLVMARFVDLMARYRLKMLHVDHHALVPMMERARDSRISLVPIAEGNQAKVDRFTVTRTAFHEGRVRMPADQRLIRQLKGIVAKLTPGGMMSIEPRLERDGTHGDLAAAAVVAISAAASFPNRSTEDDDEPIPRIGRDYGQGDSDGWEDEPRAIDADTRPMPTRTWL